MPKVLTELELSICQKFPKGHSLLLLTMIAYFLDNAARMDSGLSRPRYVEYLGRELQFMAIEQKGGEPALTSRKAQVSQHVKATSKKSLNGDARQNQSHRVTTTNLKAQSIARFEEANLPHDYQKRKCEDARRNIDIPGACEQFG